MQSNWKNACLLACLLLKKVAKDANAHQVSLCIGTQLGSTVFGIFCDLPSSCICLLFLECNNSTGHNDWLVWLAIWTLLHQATTARASCPRPELEGLLRKIDSICLNLSHAASIKSRVLLRSVDVHVCPWMSVDGAVLRVNTRSRLLLIQSESPHTLKYTLSRADYHHRHTVRCVNEKLLANCFRPLYSIHDAMSRCFRNRAFSGCI